MDPQESQASSSSSTRRPSATVGDPALRDKREQVPAACTECRKSKIKCDAKRPCTKCVQRNRICRYDTHVGETVGQAQKRRYNEITERSDNLEQIFAMLKSENQADVLQIVRDIRQGQPPEAVIASMMDRKNDNRAALSDRRQEQERFMISLAHSTGSIYEILRLASWASNGEATLPTPLDLREFRNQVLRLERIEALLMLRNPLDHPLPALSIAGGSRLATGDEMTGPTRLLASTDRDPSPHGDVDDIPHHVPAAPWTEITRSDFAVSHLVSLFLTWINPSWRFVEQDLFLHAMRSRSPDSYFCSSLLVNSICAIACLHSEHPIAFAEGSNERVTRGLHFHKEALRLWRSEQEHGSFCLATVQALCVLSLDSNYRAKDKVGLVLIPVAVQLLDNVPLQENVAQRRLQGISEEAFARGRFVTHWTVKCTYITMCIAFMRAATVISRADGLDMFPQLFSDTAESWVAYPQKRSAIIHRPNLCFLERCKLADLFVQLLDLIVPSEEQPKLVIRELARAVDEMASRLQNWHQRLPHELRLAWPMSVDRVELHASYFCALMILWNTTRGRFNEPRESLKHFAPLTEPNDEEALFGEHIAKQNLGRAIGVAQQAAQLLRDFRMTHGSKVNPAWLLQLQAVAAGVLVHDHTLVEPAPAMILDPDSDMNNLGVRDSGFAFEEVLRSMYGSGSEVMISRAIAQMVFRDFKKRKLIPSSSVLMLWKMFQPSIWRKDDLMRVQSAFPNFAQTSYEQERLTEILSRWEPFQSPEQQDPS